MEPCHPKTFLQYCHNFEHSPQHFISCYEDVLFIVDVLIIFVHLLFYLFAHREQTPQNNPHSQSIDLVP